LDISRPRAVTTKEELQSSTVASSAVLGEGGVDRVLL
jgi:hypothetical protein